jgi:membrane-associated phospholipid phosphatase
MGAEVARRLGHALGQPIVQAPGDAQQHADGQRRLQAGGGPGGARPARGALPGRGEVARRSDAVTWRSDVARLRAGAARGLSAGTDSFTQSGHGRHPADAAAGYDARRMTPFNTLADSGFWHGFTRLGEAQLLLPALLLAALWLALQPGGWRPAGAWLGGTAAAAMLTTATKVAFIGYGLGLAALDFTGISGHAMFAAATLPPLLHLAGGALPAPRRRALLALGVALAAAVAVSRVRVQAHSWSEVAAGWALGMAVSALALRAGPWPALPLARWLPLLLAAWLLAGIVTAPPSRTHDWVTRLALAQSGRAQPYQRWQLHRDALPPAHGMQRSLPLH